MSERPDLASQWHPTKNGALGSGDVSIGSSRKVWWLGSCEHEWAATVSNRVGKGSGCPYCSRKAVLSGFNDLASRHPDLAEQWHPNKNGDLKPEAVVDGTPRRVWWLGSCGHEWYAAVRERVRGTGCPYCVGNRTLSGFNDLVSQRPDLSAQWHPMKNGALRPADVTVGTNERVWWLGLCGHEWRSSIAARSGRITAKILNNAVAPSRGSGCPFCSGRRPVAGVNDLATTHAGLAADWHTSMNGELAARDVSAGSKRRVWWRDELGHEWVSTVKDRVQGHGCPFCSGRRVIVGTTDLATRCPAIAEQWHPERNGDLTASDVTFGSARQVWWLGPCGHEWRTRVTYRTVSGGTGCPLCFPHWSRAEKEVVAYFRTAHPDLAVVENGRDQLGGRLELDIYLPELRVGIEFNGLYWHDEAEPAVKRRHEAKASRAADAGIALVIVWEDDWKDRREDVEYALTAIVLGEPIPLWMGYAR